MGNACRAAQGERWQAYRVEKRVTTKLEALRPAVKERWEDLLRLEPTLTPLANPDTLVFMMDATLTQLLSALAAPSFKRWMKKNPTCVAPMQSRCHCSINPLLTYYTTGELALRAAAGSSLGQDLEEVLLYFHSLGQREIESLCGVCAYKDSAACPDTQMRNSVERDSRLRR